MLNICVPDTQTLLEAEFFVMPGTADTLLGRSSSEELGVLKIGVTVNACESRNVTDKKAALKAKYPQVFTGLEKLKIFQLKLHVDESVTPVAQAMRRIPFSRKQKLVDKLEELEALGVIEKVNGPTSWINPLVVVEKPNGDVCICLDMRQANRAILREKHPVPTIEETLQELSGAKIFSNLDLNIAFHQVELTPESRDITTFAGPNGLYRYKLSPTFEPEPYQVVEKNGNPVVIENSAGQSKMRNAGHMKKFVDPGTERGATETKLPAPSIATDTPKEGVTFEQDPVGGFQQNS